MTSSAQPITPQLLRRYVLSFDGLSRLAEQFATPGSNNRVNIDRLINEIRKDTTWLEKTFQLWLSVRLTSLSYAADFSSKYTRSTGNAVIFKELATMKHRLLRSTWTWFNRSLCGCLKRGYPGYDNVVKGIAEMVPRVNYSYDGFIKNMENPIGILIALTPER